MRKLRLRIDELHVESFAVTGPAAQAGTVQGQVANGTPIPIYEPPSGDYACATVGTCIGPTYCCGATGPTNPVCIGPTYCCNPTANTGCCAPQTDACPGTGYYPTCGASCPPEECIP